MTIYLLNITLLIIYGVIFQQEKTQKNKKTFCILASLNWIILSGLRHVSIGADTIKYAYYFDQAKNIAWISLWEDRVNIFIHKSMGKDPGYIVFQKLIQLFTMDYRLYLIIIAVIFTVPLGIWIYRKSSNPLMSFIIYSCLFYSFFAITGARQTLATAIVVIVGYKHIRERNLWIFLLLILIGTSIHFSVICYLPFYFIANKEITNRYLTLCGCGFLGIFIFKGYIYNLASSLIGYDQYLAYQGDATWTFTILLIALSIVTLMKRGDILEDNPQAKHYINALLIAVLLVPFTFVNPASMRIIQYFSLFIILLVPEIINTFQKRERFFVYLISASALIILLINNNPTYIFFWQV